MVQFPNSEEVSVEKNIWYWNAQAGDNNKIISEKKRINSAAGKFSKFD